MPSKWSKRNPRLTLLPWGGTSSDWLYENVNITFTLLSFAVNKQRFNCQVTPQLGKEVSLHKLALHWNILIYEVLGVGARSGEGDN